jgi:hypothetical protein
LITRKTRTKQENIEAMWLLRRMFEMKRVENIGVGYEVLMAVVMQCTVFWDITSYSLLKVDRDFGGTYIFVIE